MMLTYDAFTCDLTVVKTRDGHLNWEPMGHNKKGAGVGPMFLMFVCFYTASSSLLLALKMCDLYFAYHTTKTSVMVYVCVHVPLLSSPLFTSLCGIMSHCLSSLCCQSLCVSDGEALMASVSIDGCL